VLVACGGGYGGGNNNPPPAPPVNNPPPASVFTMSSLISDGSQAGTVKDTNLVNPWGIVIAPNAPVWVANNATGTSTLYDGTSGVLGLIVQLPGGANGAADATGIVANPSTTDFAVTNGTTTAPARFIFDGESGTIMGWAPTVDGTHAIIAFTATDGAVYKGLAVAADSGANFLYATDFKNNKVDVFDKNFAKVAVAGGFTDPTLPAGYAPFGIQAVTVGTTTTIYVTYAQTQAGSNDNANGAGLGLVNTFDTKGTLVKHLIPTGGKLNAPWGVALAPADLGTFANTVLIGNFGDGAINAYKPDTGEFVDTIKNSAGAAIATPGLWGIAFGNGVRNQPTKTLFFAAGTGGETAGLYGRIDLGATAPDIVAPTITISAPAAASNVSGTTAITVTAADNVGVANVQFKAGTTVLGTVTAAPFTFNWDTTQTANGAASLTAIATDAAGNATTSAAVSVTVNNQAPPPPAPVTFTQLKNAIFNPICSQCHIGANAPRGLKLDDANAYANLVNVASDEVPTILRVKPNDPANSYIVQKIEGTATVGGRMPLGQPALDAATIQMVKDWISQGAQNN
jgi:uncharacterized protein (TIGR03118 family)